MSLLVIKALDVRYGPRVVLQELEWSIAERGLVVLMGPGGAGKSTLLRVLCDLEKMRETAFIRGTLRYEGAPLEDSHRRPVGVAQHPRVYARAVSQLVVEEMPDRDQLTLLEQRERVCEHLSEHGLGALIPDLERGCLELPRWKRILFLAVRAAQSEARLVCIDEPTRDLEDGEAERLLEYLRRLATTRAVLWVSHHQARARRFAESAALLAGGSIVQSADAAAFFTGLDDPVLEHYLRTGGCALPSPEATAASLENPSAPVALDADAWEEVPPDEDDVLPAHMQHRPGAPTSRQGPRGFHWLVGGRLGGARKPGLFDPLEQDLQALARLGATILVTLTEEPLVNTPRAGGLRVEHFPMVDMGVPTPEAARAFCAQVEAWLQADEVVVLHCHAGLGRTGTLLALQLIHCGMSARAAKRFAWQRNPRWIQSEAQLKFLDAMSRDRRVPESKQAM